MKWAQVILAALGLVALFVWAVLFTPIGAEPKPVTNEDLGLGIALLIIIQSLSVGARR